MSRVSELYRHGRERIPKNCDHPGSPTSEILKICQYFAFYLRWASFFATRIPKSLCESEINFEMHLTTIVGSHIIFFCVGCVYHLVHTDNEAFQRLFF